jgi:hypothetical protein
VSDDDGEEKEFAPAAEILFRLDHVTDDLETVERLVSNRTGVPACLTRLDDNEGAGAAAVRSQGVS